MIVQPYCTDYIVNTVRERSQLKFYVMDFDFLQVVLEGTTNLQIINILYKINEITKSSRDELFDGLQEILEGTFR